jgi:hypothetical protein
MNKKTPATDSHRDREYKHAHAAARQGVLKGLDKNHLATAFMLEGVRTIFEVDEATALGVLRHGLKSMDEYCKTVLGKPSIL